MKNGRTRIISLFCSTTLLFANTSALAVKEVRAEQMEFNEEAVFTDGMTDDVFTSEENSIEETIEWKDSDASSEEISGNSIMDIENEENVGSDDANTEDGMTDVEEESMQLFSLENAVSIISEPIDFIGLSGTQASFKVTAQGEALTYQWEYSTDGGKSWKTSNCKSSSATCLISSSTDGRLYRCVVTDTYGNQAVSQSAVIHCSSLCITAQPEDYKGKVDEKAVFIVEAEGNGLTYQWEYSKDNGMTWVESANKTKTAKCSIGLTTNGWLYRCAVTDAAGASVMTRSAKVILFEDLKIITQPVDYEGKTGTKAVFQVEAAGSGLIYLWEYSKDNGKSWIKSASKTKIAQCSVGLTTNGWLYRCTVTDAAGTSITTKPAKVILLTDLKITAQPKDYEGKTGTKAIFRVEAEESGLSYQWEYSKDNGKSWVKSASKTNSAQCNINQNTDGWLYRCTITDAAGKSVVSDMAAVRMIKFFITKQPVDTYAKIGDKATFFIEAEGDNLSYQWEYSTNQGKSWIKSYSTATSAVCNVQAGSNGWLYRCVITDGKGNTVISDEATVFLSDLTIKTQPQSIRVLKGETAELCVEATGVALRYQWEKEEKPGEGWKIVQAYSNAGNKLSVQGTDEEDGVSYRCIVMDQNGDTVTSESALITVYSVGFEVIDGKTYYRREDGTFAKGFQTIDGERYYFGSSGAMCVGMVSVNDVRYFFDTETGRELYGFQSNGINTYYFLEGGGVQKDLSWMNGKLYYFGPTAGNVLTGWRIINGKKYYFEPDTFEAAIGFRDMDGKSYCFDEKGICYTNGFHKIDGVSYYFNESGSIKKGGFNINDTRYFADEETGALLEGYYINPSTSYRYYYDGENGALTGWQDLEDGRHFFYENGVMARGVTKIDNKKYFFDWDTGAEKYGFIDINMGHYMYFGEDGIAVTGWKTVGNRKYYFDPITAQSRSGWLTIDEKNYYLSKETYVMLTGFQEIDENMYYFAQDGSMLTGFFQVNGDTYCAYENGHIRKGEFYLDGSYYLAEAETGKLYAGFYQAENGSTYYYDGKNGRLTGLQEIEGEDYLFSDSGAMLKRIQVVDNKRFYFDPETGAKKYGFIEENGLLYYFTEDGVLTGLQKIDGALYDFMEGSGYALGGMRTVNDQTYYFDKTTYQAVSGWQVINGNTYYFGGDFSCLQNGVYEIDGAAYYFYPSGKMGRGYIKPYYFNPITGKRVTGFVNTNGYTYYFTENGALTGLQTINGKLYYFNANGVMQRGFQRVTVNGKIMRYYFDSATGEAITGIGSSNGVYYYFNGAEGSVAGLKVIDGVRYNFNSDTTASKSCVKIVDGVGYYFDSTGAQRCGFIQNNGTEFYFYPDGGYTTKAADKAAIQSGMDAAGDGFSSFMGVTYYKENGNFVKGFKTIDNKTYYFAEDNGEMLTGLRQIGGNYYYFDEKGVMKTGAVQLEGGLSFFDEDGRMLHGIAGVNYYNDFGQKKQGIILADGTGYYIDGTVGKTGFITIDGLRYYVQDGVILTGLAEIGGNYYYFDTQGVMQTGMAAVNNVNMYFDPETGARITGFVENNGRKFYMDETKGMMTGLTVINGSTYYFDNLGIMNTGLVRIGSDSYYFDTNDGRMKFGWIHDGNSIRYANLDTGILESGLTVIDGKTYYFGLTSYRMEKGWVQNGTERYYFDSDGIQKSGFTVIDGRTYYLENGGYLTGWNQIEKNIYYFNEYGVMLTGSQVIDEKEYFFDKATGCRMTGLVRNGKYYYGYLEEGGRAQGITTFSNGKTYYFKETNYCAVFGLQSFADGILYYFDKETGMRRNTSWESNGVQYAADSKGHVTVLPNQSSKLAQIVYAGAQYLGTTYGDGENQLVCSSFISKVMDAVGIELNGTANIQYSMLLDDDTVQKYYDLDELQPGDIVYYVNGDCGEGETCGFIGEIHHVGVYIGGGKMMEATSLEKNEETGEKYGYTLIRDVDNNDQICIVMIARVL